MLTPHPRPRPSSPQHSLSHHATTADRQPSLETAHHRNGVGNDQIESGYDTSGYDSDNSTVSISNASIDELVEEDLKNNKEYISTVSHTITKTREDVTKALNIARDIQDNGDVTTEEKKEHCRSLQGVLLAARKTIYTLDGESKDHIKKFPETSTAIARIDQQIDKKGRKIEQMDGPTWENTSLRDDYNTQKNLLLISRIELFNKRKQCIDAAEKDVFKLEPEANSANEYVMYLLGKVHDTLEALGSDAPYNYLRFDNTQFRKEHETLIDEETAVYDSTIDHLNKKKTHLSSDQSSSIGQSRKRNLEGMQKGIEDQVDKLVYLKSIHKHQKLNIPIMEALPPAYKTSHYEHIHTIAFQQQDTLDALFISDEAYTRHKLTKKGVNDIQQHRGNIESVAAGVRDETLKTSLQSIAVGKKAADHLVKPTKITLDLHGNKAGNLSSMSFGNTEGKVVSPEKIGNYIANHLAAGDYKDKLTIALRSCYGGYEGEKGDDASSVERIANVLAKKGYTGIKLTANKTPSSIETISTKNQYSMGAMISETDDGPVKLSKSNNKVTIRI